jgi:hypothetical protein
VLSLADIRGVGTHRRLALPVFPPHRRHLPTLLYACAVVLCRVSCCVVCRVSCVSCRVSCVVQMW